ncbi:hypothetical protein JCM10207_002018 [Rhodosporidiobolus poonsookiae]
MSDSHTHSKDEELAAGTVAMAYDDKAEAVTKKDDVAGAFLAKIAASPDAAALLAPWEPKEEKRMLRWKIDPIIMTVCQFMCMMGAVDKVCIGSAAVLGLRTDLHLVGQEYSWISSAISFGVILAVYPTLFLMQKMPAGKYMAANCAAWGIILMCSAAAKNFAGLFVARFVLGLFEAVIFAGMGLIISAWWLKHEQGWRNAVMLSTLSSVMNGILAYGCALYTPGKLKQWQLLFILVGAITLLWSVVVFIFLPDSPTTTWWLSDREKVIAVQRTSVNRTGMENKVFNKSHVFEAFFKDPKTYIIFCINLVLTIPNTGLTTFNGIIINGLGFSPKETMLLGIPTGVISWIASLFFGWLSAKTGRRHLIAIISCLPPLVGTIMLHTIPRSNVGGSLAGLYILYCYWGSYTSVQIISYANTAGYTKKAAVFGWAYIGYSVGALVGPQVFKAKEAPRYQSGVAAMLSCYCVAIVLLFVLWAYTAYLNRRKVEQLAKYEADHGTGEGLLDAWHDQTDFENPKFRYET